LPPLRKTKSITLKAAKEKSNNSSDDSDDEYGFALFARNFRKMMKFRNKNAKSFKNPKGDSTGTG
jgi:hypothetical protein